MSSKEDIISRAKKLRRDFALPGQPLQETFDKIFADQHITIQYEEHGEHAKYEDGRWTITLPLNTPKVRDNFTIAHELGHIILEHALDEDRTVHRNGNPTQEEFEANWFAAEFLMPEDEFSCAARRCNFDERKLAEEFEVSKAAVLVRLSVLNL
ncbi:ImmA/IrrE family metallo-endopeptidase [Desulfovibrio sp.]|uniref:ImmA/IrrE family metallo-endopeptidase n=1 Tax=Desulfovibrio sp. TaxID=885 RepID=UPI0035B2040D